MALPAHHACYVYRSPEDLVTTVSAFLADGLNRGEQCWYVGKGRERSAIRRALTDRGLDVRSEERRGALTLLLAHDVYTTGHVFSPEQVMRRFSEGINEALRAGFTGFRAAGEMSWTAAPMPGTQLCEYEHLITTLMMNSPAFGLCLYPAGLAHLHQPLTTHPYTVGSNAVLHPNRLFEPSAARPGHRES